MSACRSTARSRHPTTASSAPTVVAGRRLRRAPPPVPGGRGERVGNESAPTIAAISGGSSASGRSASGRSGAMLACGEATCPDEPDSPSMQRELPVLEHQRPEVAGVEQLDVDARIELAKPAQLAVLLADEPLAERRHLEVEVEIRGGRSRAQKLSTTSPSRFHRIGKVSGLVLPADRVEIEDAGHLRLAGMGERRAGVHRRPVYPSAYRRLGSMAGALLNHTPRGYDARHGQPHRAGARAGTRSEPLPAQLRQGHRPAHAPAVAHGGAGPRDRPDDRARGVLRRHPPADCGVARRRRRAVDPRARGPRPGMRSHRRGAWRGGQVRRRGDRRRATHAGAAGPQRRAPDRADRPYLRPPRRRRSRGMPVAPLGSTIEANDDPPPGATAGRRARRRRRRRCSSNAASASRRDADRSAREERRLLARALDILAARSPPRRAWPACSTCSRRPSARIGPRSSQTAPLDGSRSRLRARPITTRRSRSRPGSTPPLPGVARRRAASTPAPIVGRPPPQADRSSAGEHRPLVGAQCPRVDAGVIRHVVYAVCPSRRPAW